MNHDHRKKEDSFALKQDRISTAKESTQTKTKKGGISYLLRLQVVYIDRPSRRKKYVLRKM